MKKGFVAITAAVALAASSLIGAAVAGIGPDRGLPIVNPTNLTAANGGYNVTDTAVPGRQGSVMCVACHTRNPASRTAYNGANAGHLGSHFVTSNFGDTSEGGGYTDGATGKTRADRVASPVYMAVSTASGFDWAGAPKYGVGSAASIDNNVNDPSTAAAQMICESCHNVVTNIGPAKLLATGFANGGDNAAYTVPGTTAAVGIGGGTGTQTPRLCLGCHGNMSAGVNAEWQFHPIAGVSGAVAYTGTHHHRNTPGTTAGYFAVGATQTAGHNMGSMDRAYYGITTTGLQMWGASYGELGSTARALTYDPATNKKVKNDATSAVTAAQGQLRVGAVNQVLCTNCHRAHNAITSAGATILMGTSNSPAVNPGITTLVQAVTGMGTNTRSTQIQNTNVLCLGCHQ